MNRLKVFPASAELAVCCLALLIAVTTALLACEPAAQTAPADDIALPAAQDTGGDALAQQEATNTPTPAPTVCIQAIDRDGGLFDICITPMPPKTPQYPNLTGDLEAKVVEFEEAQYAASDASGQSGSTAGDSVVLVEIFLSSPNTDDIAEWLMSKGVSPFAVKVDAEESSPPSSTYFVEDVGYIGGLIPVSLMGELSRLEGVVEVREPYLPEPAIVPE